MATTYEPIATTTLSSAAASYTFSSIPSTYTDLVLVINNLHTTNAIDGWFRLNGDTATNYSRTNLNGDGTSATSGRNTSVAYGYGILVTNTFSTNILNFLNYSNTTTYKTILMRSNNTSASGYAATTVDLWRATPAAINSIQIGAVSGNYDIGSTFTLYGIKAA